MVISERVNMGVAEDLRANTDFARQAERLEVEVVESADENPRSTIDRYSGEAQLPATGLPAGSVFPNHNPLVAIHMEALIEVC
jgi:hypothetical protein